MKTTFVIDDVLRRHQHGTALLLASVVRSSQQHVDPPNKTRVFPNDKRARFSELTSLSHDLRWTLLIYTAMSTEQTIAHFQKDM